MRFWSVISGDKVLAEAFRVGQELRQQWIQTPVKAVKEELKTKGDIHIQNVYRFFKKWVSKDDPMRQAVKAIVFGVLYGKSAKTLGADIGQDENYAQNVIDTMFNTFKAGGKWTERMKKSAREKGYTYSIIGRRRNLYAFLTGDRSIVSQQVRRGGNAPIQGMASEAGLMAGRVVSGYYYDEWEHLIEKFDPNLSYEESVLISNRVVHDANYYSIPYSMVIPFVHMLQHGATYGVAREMEKAFGFKFTVDPEIEIDFSARGDHDFTWDWSLPSLIGCLTNAVFDAHEIGQLDGSPKEVMEKILAPYKDKKTRKYLQEKYPLLGVKDLDTQIVNGVPDYLNSLKENVKKAEAMIAGLTKKSTDEEKQTAEKSLDAAKTEYKRAKAVLV